MHIDRTRQPHAKARTLSRRTARKVKHARTVAVLVMATLFPADLSAFNTRTVKG